MYVRKWLEEELLNEGLMDVSPESQAMTSVREQDHAQAVYAGQCARRVFRHFIVGVARKFGLKQATEVALDNKFLEDIFVNKYQVHHTKVEMAIHMVQLAWKSVLAYMKDHAHENGKEN